jgi:hypothetical protein
MLEELGYFEREDGNYVNFSISILGKIISCACGCIFNSARSSTNTARRR